MSRSQDLYVFAYGSLIWRPDFAFLEAVPATLHGWHRAFCVYSTHYRGTAARPGLVLGLDRGGSCRGLVYRVAGDAVAETLAILRAREQVNYVYLEQTVPLRTPRGPVAAVTYAIDRSHAQYAGKLPFETQVAMIARAEGLAGRNRDYLAATAAELRRLGLADRALDRLEAAVAATPTPPLGDHMVAGEPDD